VTRLEPAAPRVLIVDDEPDIRFMLHVVLEAFGAVVVGEAGDGDEAVGLAGELQPEVVVLDLMMPTVSGFVALPRIREIARDARVVVCTAARVDAEVEEALRGDGASDIVLKDTNLTRRLIEAIG
jgi:CheY-like chemotaxis protein